MNKGILISKQERDRIPIKTMFGNEEDELKRHKNQKHSKNEEETNFKDNSENCRNTIIESDRNDISKSKRREKLIEDEKIKQVSSNQASSRQPTDKPAHQPIIKVNSQKISRQGLATAGPKINFQSSLSPDFLNLFAH